MVLSQAFLRGYLHSVYRASTDVKYVNTASELHGGEKCRKPEQITERTI